MTSKKQNTFKLKNLKPDGSFQVPNGYFEAFPARLQARIHSGNEPIHKKSLFRFLTIPQLAVAASFMGLMILAYSGIKFVVSNQDLKSGIQQTGIAELPDYSLYDLDETMVYDLYNETNVENNSVNSSIKNDTDEMMEYLLLEDADIEVLMQEL